MREYATTVSGTAPARRLDGLASAAHRVNSAVDRVGDFVDRFNGPDPEQQSGDARAAESDREPHGIHLERLFDALDRLENRLAALEQIG